MKEYVVSLVCKSTSGCLANKLLIIKASSEYEALGYVVSQCSSCGDIVAHAVTETTKIDTDLTEDKVI